MLNLPYNLALRVLRVVMSPNAKFLCGLLRKELAWQQMMMLLMTMAFVVPLVLLDISYKPEIGHETSF